MQPEIDIHKELAFLAETDEQAAELRVDVDRKEWLLDKTEGLVFLEQEGTIAEKEAKVSMDVRVETSQRLLLDAKLASLKMDSKRKTAMLRVEIWRTLSANRRQGNVT